MAEAQIVAIQMGDRCRFAPRLQEVLTEHGCVINVRLGIPSRDGRNGLILLVVEGEEDLQTDLLDKLRGVPEVAVSSMGLPAR